MWVGFEVICMILILGKYLCLDIELIIFEFNLSFERKLWILKSCICYFGSKIGSWGVFCTKP